MMNQAIRKLLATCRLAAGLIAVAAGSAAAQNYPAKPIRLVVPFGTGGSNDIVGRVVAQKLGENLGQPVIVDNRPGAGGTVGTDAVVKAAPDGYTLMIGTVSTIAANVALYPKRDFDPLRHLTPIMQVSTGSYLMAIPAAVPAKTLRDFIALAKAKPGQLNYATSGPGSSPHLMGEMFNRLANVALVPVPYKSGGAAIADLSVDRVQLFYSDLAALLPFVRGGQVRALAVTTPTRSALLPELPTMAEAGVPGYEATSWYGILGPAGMPPELVKRLHAELARVTASADVKERFATLGIEPYTDSPEAFASYIREEVAKWTVAAKAARVELE
jgi:tripartite-type tricarboxylate transporter receptor subunit TctC